MANKKSYLLDCKDHQDDHTKGERFWVGYETNKIYLKPKQNIETKSSLIDWSLVRYVFMRCVIIFFVFFYICMLYTTIMCSRKLRLMLQCFMFASKITAGYNERLFQNINDITQWIVQRF